VLDASVVTDALASAGPPGGQARRLLSQEPLLHVPGILTAEVTSALRSMLRRGDLDPDVARLAALQAATLRTRQYPFEPFLPRVWELRDDITTYDAWWVALAEQLGAPLVTADERLRRATGPRCEVLSPEQALDA
jgi:predicted nucleic acid-binding protein